MSKQFFLIYLILILSGALIFARGGNEQPSSEQLELNEIDVDGVEVIFWHQHTRSREEELNRIIDDFNQTNPWGITVIGEYAGSYEDIYNKMITGIVGNLVPDLVVAYQSQAASYMLADGLVDIETYINHPEYGLNEEDRADFIEGIYNSDYNAQFDNKRLGFPPNRSMEVLYYNIDWLRELGYEAPPRTWEEFADMIIAATDEEEGTYGLPISPDASNIFAQIISRGGDGYLDASGVGYEFDIPEFRDAVVWMKNLYDRGAARKISERYGNQTDFANSFTPFSMGSTSGIPYYQAAIDASDRGTFNWSVAYFPYTTAEPVMDMYGASVSIPRTGPEKQLAAWLFVKHYTSPEIQKKWSEVSGYFPVRSSVRDGMGDYIAGNSQYGDAFDILLNSEIKTEPPIISYDQVRGLIAAAYNAMIDGADISSTLNELTEEANILNEEMKP